MTKFKPFTTFNTSMDYPNNCFLEEYVDEESINHFNGKPYHARKEFVGLGTRRHGIDVYVLPTKKDGVVVWKWSISQCGAKRLSNGGYKFSNYSRQWKEGFADTFEEGNKIVSDIYAKWMNERPTS